ASLRAIVDEAHHHGLPVTAHAHSAKSIADAVAAGVDGIEHATFMTADGVDAPETVIRAIAARRIAVGWTVGRDPARPGPVPPQIASRMAALITARRRLYEAEALLVPGSDAGVTPAKPHDVLRFAPGDLAAVGLGPAEILQAMTSGAAQACGLGHRKGRIAVGFDADILAIDGNPLQDPAAIRQVRAVYISGRPVTPGPGSPATCEDPAMRQLLSAPAPNRRPAPLAAPHLVPLVGEWALWRDIAVRTAGFPVSGLDVFGSQDERAGLRAVARDPLFQTAVTWQNRAAMHNAVGKIADGAPAPGSRQGRGDGPFACSGRRYGPKNDTIGFCGPLAGGRLAGDAPAPWARCGQLISERTVQFEAGAIQALAEPLDADPAIPAGPGSE